MADQRTVTDTRRQLIQQQSILNGLDFVEVVTPPAGTPATQLRATFVNPLGSVPDRGEFKIVGGERIRSIAVSAVGATDDDRTVLVSLAGTGDFSPYRLQMVTDALTTAPPPWIDPVLASACFSFSLGCMSTLPCDDEVPCEAAPVVEPKLDYFARDWESLRAVLLDRISVLQPEWTDQNVADVRIALIEILAELGDRAAYRQDAIATEAYLGTARRRISVRRHARLVDYAMSDGANARTWIQFAVPGDVLLESGGAVPVVPKGTRFLTGGPDSPCLVAAQSDAETAIRRAGALEFEALSELNVVSGAHSAMRFYTWSGAQPGLPIGATCATLRGHLPKLAIGDVLVLIENRDPVGPRNEIADADPLRRQPVRLTHVNAGDEPDPLRDKLTGELITEITWHSGDALRFPLMGALKSEDGEEFDDGALALGNIVLADHGAREDVEILGPVPDTGRVQLRLAYGPVTQVPRQLVRSTAGSDAQLVRFDPDGSADSALTGPPDVVLPNIDLTQHALVNGVAQDLPWNIQPDLISSGSNRDYVVEVDDEGVAWLRFGRYDGGLVLNGQPPNSDQGVMRATYRTGNGVVGNVGAGAVRTVLDDGWIAASLRSVLAAGIETVVANPVAAVGGTEPETIEEVRQRAPFAFRRQERAVTADDYASRAEQFGSPGPRQIQRAVASIRWTGSWHTVVVAVDPIGADDVDDQFLSQVADYLDGYRMAGHDLQVVAATYAPIEVGLAISVDPDYRRDLVQTEILQVMSNRRLPDGRLGLFHPDRLSFGTSVYLGPIVAAAQGIPGVATVSPTRFSRYRLPGTDARASGRIEIGPHEIARLDNDPSRPELGQFHLDALAGGR
jgi:hypothetical protein